MAMQVESLEVLEKAAVAPAQARAIVRAIEIEIAGAKDTLATKHDVLALKQDFQALRGDMQVLRGHARPRVLLRHAHALIAPVTPALGLPAR